MSAQQCRTLASSESRKPNHSIDRPRLPADQLALIERLVAAASPLRPEHVEQFRRLLPGLGRQAAGHGIPETGAA